MKKHLTLTVVLLAVFFGIIFGIIEGKQYLTDRYLAAYVPPPVMVRAETARNQHWENSVSAVGSLRAAQGVDIASESSGVIYRVNFRGGETIAAGTELITIVDDIDVASLKSLLAQRRLAEINYEREKQLLANRTISRADFDKTDARLKDASGQVEKTEAIIARKHLRAPFTGRIGIPLVEQGEYVTEGQGIVTLQALETLEVNFSLPEQYLPWLQPNQRVRCRLHAYPEQVFAGTISAIDAKVDINTRNIFVRAAVPNVQLALLPGMFVNVEVIIEENVPVVVVPETAVSYNLYGDSVFVIGAPKDNNASQTLRVERRYISAGKRRDGLVAITEGLNAGELVVSAGALKLDDGAAVIIEDQQALAQ